MNFGLLLNLFPIGVIGYIDYYSDFESWDSPLSYGDNSFDWTFLIIFLNSFENRVNGIAPGHLIDSYLFLKVVLICIGSSYFGSSCFGSSYFYR